LTQSCLCLCQAWTLRGALDKFISLPSSEDYALRTPTLPSLSFVDSMPIVFRSVDDVVMGGRSQSGIIHSSGLKAGLFSGDVSLANNGGFCSVRGEVRWDLSNASAMQITASSSSGGRFRLILHDSTERRSINFNHEFDVKGDAEFRTYVLLLDGFVGQRFGAVQPDARLNRSTIYGVSLMIAKNNSGSFKPGTFSLAVKIIEAT
jgi:hypothetical protein